MPTQNGQDAFIRRLRTLHKISSTTIGSDVERIDVALRFALDELNLDQGYLGAIDERTNELVMQNVVSRNGEPSYGDGKRYPLAETLLGKVVQTESVLAAPDVVQTRREQGIEYSDEWRSYIAVSIRFGGRCYGAVGFKGRQPRAVPFSEIDIEFVQMTGDLIAASVDRMQQRNRLDALAFYDSLTGLPNRALLDDRLDQCIIRAKRSESSFAIFFLDLDGFKSINDRFGHDVGDEVLKVFARRLAANGREGDTVARLGGDEFIVVAPHIAVDRDALELAGRIAHCTSVPIVIDDRSFLVSVSIGISIFPIDGVDAVTLLRCADAAMSQAKSQGKNCARSATSSSGID